MAYLFFSLYKNRSFITKYAMLQLKRKETIAKWKISLFDKRWDWSISVDSLK